MECSELIFKKDILGLVRKRLKINGNALSHTNDKKLLATLPCLQTEYGNFTYVVVEAKGKKVTIIVCMCFHGNAEKMIDYETGEPHTAHTTNPVPFILVNYDSDYTLREGGALCDIAPTLIQIMGLEQPKEMTGKSLLIKK